eukprot:GDKJ01018432.1.p1 GENE.GDKJ01018432.1~~GDKJ01018432.1.p1  ORF type:complete len:429 (-),score=77.37 GDKJ01018432.1:50-1204(-)
MNCIANAVYKHNFGIEPCNKSIEQATKQILDGKADLWLMSPPCQPYTRAGLKNDEKDRRSSGLLSLIETWGSLSNPPSAAFLENVKGFEDSIAHTRLLKMLHARGYSTEEFLASPTHIGIPNSRVRYYLIAYLSGDKKAQDCPLYVPDENRDEAEAPEWLAGLPGLVRSEIPEVRRLGEFLMSKEEEEEKIKEKGFLEKYKCDTRDLKRLEKANFFVDLCGRDSICSTTITKHYLSALGKGGPIVLCDSDGRVVEETKKAEFDCQSKEEEEEGEGALKKRRKEVDETEEWILPSVDSELHIGKTREIAKSRFQTVPVSDPNFKFILRTFTERELLRLAGFPDCFSFPDSVSYKSVTQLVGNSINVTVVSRVLRHLIEKIEGKTS